MSSQNKNIEKKTGMLYLTRIITKTNTAYLGKAAQHQPDQFSDIGEGRVTSRISNVFAADVQHRAQRHSTQCNIITHVEKQAVQVFPQLHRLHIKQKENSSNMTFYWYLLTRYHVDLHCV